MKKLSVLLYFLLLPACYSWGADTFGLPEAPPQHREMLQRVYNAVCKQAHYLLTKVKPYKDNPDMRLLTKSMHHEHGIRPNTGTVLGFSFLYRFGTYDAGLTGISREALRDEYIIPMMNYLVATYDSIPTDDGKCWKNQWQSAHWAYSLGKAAWYMGDDLPRLLRNRICRVIKAEAARFFGVEPPARVKFDTASEENAWNSQIFHVASLLMPDDPDYGRWQALFRKWVVSSYVTAADMAAGLVVDGEPVGAFKGANLHDDYTLENHGIVHPDYMCAFILSLQTAVDYKMTGKNVPAFLLYNIPQVYDNLKWFSLPDGGLTYPSWQDWRLFRNPDWFINHVYMAVYAHDKDAFHHAQESLACLERMQGRHRAGNIYAEDEYYFPSTQNDLMVYLPQAWQTLHYASGACDVIDNYAQKTGVRHFESGKILLNKSERFLHSLSYGNKIMFLPTVNALDRVFDSYVGSGVGRIWLKNEQKPLPANLKDIQVKPLPVSLKDIQVKQSGDSYRVRMVLLHGDAVEARYDICARKDRLEVEETLLALRECTTGRITTSEFGLLNNRAWPYEKGYRTLSYEGQDLRFPALSGKRQEFASRRFRVDGVRFSVKKRSRGFASSYTGALRYNNARGTDVLSLNYRNTPAHYGPGQVISVLRYRIE